ncbi:MAG: hypothetical protein Q7R49_06655 [Candidatus Daviesbacteria bacterium]|nr:hypothetical protein [Candidatus Daviesbacteria bacterium]
MPLETYKVPEADTLIQRVYSSNEILADVAKDFDFTPQARRAQQLGFKESTDWSMKKGHWRVFERFNHQVPNFPEGETTTHSLLAFYDGQRPFQHAILRTRVSMGVLPGTYMHEFHGDVEKITNFYVERADFPKFPITGNEVGLSWFGSVVSGGAIFSQIPKFLDSSGSGEVILATLGGLITGEVVPFAILGMNKLLEKGLKAKLSDLTEYSVGQQVSNVLYHEDNYISEVKLQRELYKAIQDKGISLDSEEFLRNVYDTLAVGPLAEERLEEIKAEMGGDMRTESLSKQRLIKAALPLAS